MKKPKDKTIFWSLISIPLILSFIGLIFIFEASAIKAYSVFKNSFYFFRNQFFWIFIGVFLMLIFSKINYKNLYSLSVIFLLSTIFLLILVLLPGVGLRVGGANRWLDFGFFNLQPTELAKLSIILYLSSWFSKKEKDIFLPFVSLLGFLIFLILLQPDMGTAMIILSISLVIYYQSGMNIFNLILLLPFIILASFILIKIAPYRLNRLVAFFNPSSDPQGITYHINQIFISLSRGGFFGQGFGSSRQKYLFLPEAHTDSIFAIIVEEFGFFGGVFLIFLYILFVYRIYQLLIKINDKMAKLLVSGIFAFFNFQILINLAGMVGLFPLTGVPLPFVSYGGSNLLISYILVGILLNIYKNQKRL